MRFAVAGLRFAELRVVTHGAGRATIRCRIGLRTAGGVSALTPTKWLQELAYPLTNGVVLLALVGFYALVKLALAAGLFGLWLMIVILPAVFRFLMSTADARVAGRDPGPPGVETFNWVSGAWALLPAVLLGAAGLGVFSLTGGSGVVAGGLAGLGALLVIPASIGVLGLTRSPLNSLHPAALLSLIRLCGPSYFIVPATIVAMLAVVYLLRQNGLPAAVLHLLYGYLLALLFTLTGAVVFASDAAKQVDISDAVLADENTLLAKAEGERQKTLDHAYGLISRGNREGGFAHIDSYLQRSGSVAGDYRWFFDQMLHWEDSEQALFFAQRYLRFLLDGNEQFAALKLLARCQHVNARFRPLPDDRQRLVDLARQHNRDDLARLLS